jgi:hypothetical protein
MKKKNGNGNRGKKTGPQTVEHKRKRSESNKGKKRSVSFKEFRRKYMVNGGSVYAQSFVTEEGKKRVVEKLTGRTKETHEYIRIQAEKNSGSNNYRWNPNREQVFAPYTEEFKINAPKVRKRDKHTCQLCFGSGRTVHHIDENKQDSILKNMITLCRSCHMKIHTKEKGVWVTFYQPLFKRLVNENQNRFLLKEQVLKDVG